METFVDRICDSLLEEMATLLRTVNADSLIACCAAKGLEYVFPIWFTQCGRVWFILSMPCPCHTPTMPFFSRSRHSTAVERRPVGYLPAFGSFRLPRGVPRRLSVKSFHPRLWRSPPPQQFGPHVGRFHSVPHRAGSHSSFSVSDQVSQPYTTKPNMFRTPNINTREHAFICTKHYSQLVCYQFAGYIILIFCYV